MYIFNIDLSWKRYHKINLKTLYEDMKLILKVTKINFIIIMI